MKKWPGVCRWYECECSGRALLEPGRACRVRAEGGGRASGGQGLGQQLGWQGSSRVSQCLSAGRGACWLSPPLQPPLPALPKPCAVHWVLLCVPDASHPVLLFTGRAGGLVAGPGRGQFPFCFAKGSGPWDEMRPRQVLHHFCCRLNIWVPAKIRVLKPDAQHDYCRRWAFVG